MSKCIFVFGSNEAGIHGAGAALEAYKNHGARYGKSYGHYGNSFAIPTKDCDLNSLHPTHIQMYVQGFIAYTGGHKKLRYTVTRIGCGLAGFKDEDMAPLFRLAPPNVEFDEAWRPYLGISYAYWGTYP